MDIASHESFESHGHATTRASGLDWPAAGPDGPIRDVLSLDDWPGHLARSSALARIATGALGAEARLVRANLFAKSPMSNWAVAWHQDRVVCVRERRDTPGFHAWSIKAGKPHANAPASVLRKMIALRLHLDDCGPGAGPLEVLPGTQHEVLTPEEIERAATGSLATLTARAGDVILMRPLLLHRSSRASQAVPRRVLHVEYAAEDLPSPLEWYHG